MKTSPGLTSAMFLFSAVLVIVAMFSVMGTIGWGLTGLLQ